MTGTLIAVFKCDFPSCEESLKVPEGLVGSITAARLSYVGIGWRAVGARDFCPWHTKDEIEALT